MAEVVLIIAIHELSHLLVAGLFGFDIRSVSLTMGGVILETAPHRSVTAEILLSLAGSLGGLLTSLLFWRYGLHHTALWSVVMSLFNLLPVPGLDGGRVLYTLLSTRSPATSYDTAVKVGYAVSLVLLLVGGWYYMTTGQYLPLFAGVGALLTCVSYTLNGMDI